MPIRLLVGLGNPGPEYEDTRHNAGFWLVDRYASELGASFKSERDFFGRVARFGERWMLKPQKFMNLSGQAVGAVAKFYKIAPAEILVAHDELDLDPGVVKFKKGGGHAGHNGLRDIVSVLGTPEFHRLRIGIGHPRTLELDQDVASFVLHPPRKSERPLIEDAIDRAIAVLPEALEGLMEAAMMKLHRKS